MSDQAALAIPAASHRRYEVSINDTVHSFGDPIVTGEQILQAAKLFPTDEYLVFEKLRNGQLEERRLDESIDLRAEGIERLITFKSDRSFRFTLDGRRFEWGLPFITGLQ